ncbi:MAG: Hsp20/alpha crystallin family protein [Bacteroidia bacterium]|nr:Hsp20/alpha crystallin family protein [Bacteroidia bacterium]
MTIVKWNGPYGGQSNNQLSSPFKSILEDFFGSSILKNDYAAFVPAVNVSETENSYELDLSAPGYKKEDFKIELNKGVLSISGTHNSESEQNSKTVYRKEFNYGSFQRSFTVSDDIDFSKIEAKYESGILKLVLPKKEEKVNSVKEIKIS